MSSSDDIAVPHLQAAVACLAAAARSGLIHDLPEADLQNLLTTAMLAFSGRAQVGDLDDPFGPASGVTATDVAVVASAMLRAVNMQVFELGLWQTWGKLQPTPGAEP